ncbi:MAG TPA: bifunctional 4-hydroxy-2-oxoglutarate aldolase/2-dehydro-3-deoxy-phosphogluconate aldolase [Anaerolineales bacterium]|nr:bifunctional 4-hydroxy-2-oxoglutarate aldolase/2-dehydro-3-deoxy-phosphogluconate aldolase [Anaerolineales bacterium]
MDKKVTLEKLQQLGVMAVIRGPTPELTLKMVEALIAGGVKGIEITYSTPNAAEVVRQLDKQFSNQIVLGMGTLTEATQVDEAIGAGARFLVSPICDPLLGKTMIASGVPVMIGALTPTEVFQAYKLGSDVVKIFPGSLGGPSYMKALKAPFPNIPMMPTGGVSATNVGEWLAAGAFAVGAGSELCPPKLAKEGRFDEISMRAREFIKALEEARSTLKL